jgi:hypothetical protein
MDNDDILQMNHFKKSGIRTSQIFGSFANQVGGYEHVTFSLQDMYNEVDKERRSKSTDSRTALAYLRSLKSSDQLINKEGWNICFGLMVKVKWITTYLVMFWPLTQHTRRIVICVL